MIDHSVHGLAPGAGAAEAFGEAWEAAPAHRARALLGLDPALRRHVESLLKVADAAAGFLESPRWSLDDGGEAPPLAAGTRIGRYTIVSLIAEGGMGAVYRARQDEPAREIALKLVRPGCVTPGVLRRMRREPRLLARLQHPGIAQVYEAGVHRGDDRADQPWFAMELVDGRPITAASRNLSVRARLDLLAQVAEAVAHAHQRAVIHLDLKPANILVDGAGRARVLDFGVARSITPDAGESVETEGGHAGGGLAGTIPYMSPEQLGGDPEGPDVRADVYALGVVAYEVLTGGHPAGRVPRTVPEALGLAARGPVRPSSIDRALRGDVERVLMRALAPAAADRYPSMADLARDLRAGARGEPITRDRGRTGLDLVRLLVRRHPAFSAGLAGAMLALSVGVVATAWQAVRAARAEAHSTRRADDLRLLARRLLEASAPAKNAIGALEVRRAWIDAALPALEILAAEAPHDRALQSDLAQWRVDLAEAQAGVGTAGSGDHDAAVASYHSAIVLLESLVGTPPDPAVLSRLDRAQWLLANLHMAAGRATEARAGLWALASTREALVAADRANWPARVLLWNVYERLGRFAGTPDEARAIDGRATEFTVRHPPPDPTHEGDLANAGGIALAWARLKDHAGDRAGSLDLLEQARSLLEPALTANPGHRSLRLTLADTWRYEARTRQAMGDAKGSLAAFEQAAAGYGTIHRDGPHHGDAADILVTLLCEYTIALGAAAPADARAEAVAREAVAVAEFMWREDRTDQRARLRLVQALAASGGALHTLSGSWDRAREPIERARAIIAEEAAARPLGPEWQEVSKALARAGPSTGR